MIGRRIPDAQIHRSNQKCPYSLFEFCIEFEFEFERWLELPFEFLFEFERRLEFVFVFEFMLMSPELVLPLLLADVPAPTVAATVRAICR